MLLEESSPLERVTETAPASAPRQDHNSDRNVLLGVTAAFGLSAGAAYLVQLVLPALPALAMAIASGAALAWAAREKATEAWIGAAAWVATCAGATVAVLEIADTQRHRVGLALAMAAAGGLAATALWLWQLLQQVALSNVLPRVSRIFAAPTTGLAPATVGAGMAFPLIGTYAPNTIDSDSGWIAASMQEVRDNGVRLLQNTHESLGPHLTLSPLIALDGHRAAILLTIGTMIGLVALTAYLAWRISGNGTAAFAAAAALLVMPALLEQTDYYPMYAAAYFLGYGSIWLLHRAMSNPLESRLLAVAAGIGLVAAYEAHSVVMTFMMAPFLLLILHPWKRARGPFGIAIAAILVASIPRIVINLSIGSFEGIRRTYNNSWFIQQGYLREVNLNFHGQNASKSPINYVGNIPNMVEGAAGGLTVLLLLAAPAMLAIFYATWRTRLFAIATGGMFFLALVIAGPGVYDRYVTPLATGLAIAVGVGIVKSLKEPGTSRLLGTMMLLAIIVAAFNQLNMTVEAKVRQHVSIANGPMSSLVARMDNDKYVLGIRSQQLTRIDANIRTMSGRKMTEEDFITYVTWSSDEDIVDLMDRLDIGWVFVLPWPRNEVEYHETWLKPNYGETVRHPLELADSEHFCLVTDIEGYRLYRYGQCQPGDEEVTNHLGSADPRLNPYREAAGLPPIGKPGGVGDQAVPEGLQPTEPTAP